MIPHRPVDSPIFHPQSERAVRLDAAARISGARGQSALGRSRFGRSTFGRRALALVALGALAAPLACKASGSAAGAGVQPKQLADAVHAALEANRTVYTRDVVNRLQNELGVIKASEHWKEDKALPLPAQMFRMGAELAQQQEAGVHFALLSPWPISRQNMPRTEVEKAGLDFVAKNPGQNYYGSEKLGDSTFFTAVYPDKAIAQACVDCHNQHASSPRRDFALGDVMGGVVVRVAQ